MTLATMNFYELLAPKYETDGEAAHQNPVTLKAPHVIPSVDCPSCGVWASSDHLLRTFDPSALEQFKGISILNLENWMEMRGRWAEVLDLSIDRISPGLQLGPPVAALERCEINDITHPHPGHVLLARRAYEVISGIEPRSVNFVHLNAEYSNLDSKDKLPPELWQIEVVGTAWRVGVDQSRIQACSLCGRTVFPHAPMSVDEERWDKSDMFHLDRNPNRIFATERVFRVVQEQGLGNIACKPLR